MPDLDQRFFALLLSSVRSSGEADRSVEEMSSQEARRSPRFSLRRRVWCEGDHITLYLQSQNISSGGLFLRTATPLPAGTRARVTIRVDGVELVADVEIVWVAPAEAPVPGMGLKLIDILEGEEALARLLSQAAAGSG